MVLSCGGMISEQNKPNKQCKNKIIYRNLSESSEEWCEETQGPVGHTLRFLHLGIMVFSLPCLEVSIWPHEVEDRLFV